MLINIYDSWVYQPQSHNKNDHNFSSNIVWGMEASDNLIDISAENALLPDWYQAIFEIDAELL